MHKIGEIKDLQNLILPIAVYFDSICRKYNLRYSLTGGSLIGAIRHKGFIPWDDDLDVMMPRPDFDKLVDILKNEISPEYEMMNPYDLSSFYAGAILKLYRKDTLIKEYPDKFNLHYGVFLDVFAVDGLPDSIEEALTIQKKVHYAHKKVYAYASCRYRINSFRRGMRCLLKGWGTYGLKQCRRLFYKNPFEKANFAGFLIGGLVEETRMSRESFEHYIDVSFEGHQLMALRDYDQFLTQVFGDYMTLPPKDKRTSGHDFEAYKL